MIPLKPLLRTIRNLAAAFAEQVWLLGFTLVGRIARPPVQHWSSPGGQRVLVVAPHPDDEAIGCGGTLLLHSMAGDDVCIAYATDGRRSRAGGLGPEEMARRRKHEAMAGARALAAGRVEWLGLPEGEWSAEQLTSKLVVLIGDLAPQLIYAPSQVDFHPEHYRVACALALAISALPPNTIPLVRIYQVQAPLTSILTNLVTDTSTVVRAQTAALQMYVTQTSSTRGALRQRRYAAAFYRLPGHAEEFWELPAEWYVALHTTPDWPCDTIRGMRRFPWSDPLAYLWGRSERRRVAGAPYQASQNVYELS